MYGIANYKKINFTLSVILNNEIKYMLLDLFVTKISLFYIKSYLIYRNNRNKRIHLMEENEV